MATETAGSAAERPLRVLALNCTLKPGPEDSSTQRMLQQVLDAFAADGAVVEQVRVVDHDVRPGTSIDMGDGDGWPALREKVMAADIVGIGAPTWAGHMSSVAQRVIERLDAELSETDAQGRVSLADKVAFTAVVGNEDGAHKVTADLYQALVDFGFTVASQGGVYWNGEAMHTTDYKDLAQTPETVAETITTLVRNVSHLAGMLRDAPYPAP